MKKELRQRLFALICAGIMGFSAVPLYANTADGITNEKLDDTPEFLPMSDKENKRDWSLSLSMSDEFNGTEIDETKWHTTHPFWDGRQPSAFHEENVRLEDGKLVVSATYEDELTDTMKEANEKLGKDEYHTYATGALVSKEKTGYGYYEVKARTAPIGVSSAFWFRDPNEALREIDVFEQVGRPEDGYTLRKDGSTIHINTHRFDGDKNIETAYIYNGEVDFTEDYHVYGLEWGPDYMRFYLDGKLLQEITNAQQEIYEPLYAIFDMETNLFDITKNPSKDKFKTYVTEDGEERYTGDFHVDYFRVWRSDVPQDKNKQEIEIKNKEHEVKTVEAVYGSPVVEADGKVVDSAWDKAIEVKEFHAKSGTKIADVSMKTMWDEENVYILTDVTDAETFIHADKNTKHESDCTELYINALNERDTKGIYDENDYFVKLFPDGSVDKSPNTPEGIVTNVISKDGGYIAQYKIPHKYYEAKAGMKIGFDMQLNDASEAEGKRHSILGWNDTTNNTWQSLITVGEIVFGEKTGDLEAIEPETVEPVEPETVEPVVEKTVVLTLDSDKAVVNGEAKTLSKKVVVTNENKSMIEALDLEMLLGETVASSGQVGLRSTVETMGYKVVFNKGVITISK